MLGISQKGLNFLKAKCEEMDDEMALKKELELKSNEDQIYEFQNFGELGRENIVVNKVFTMMIRGLNKN